MRARVLSWLLIAGAGTAFGQSAEYKQSLPTLGSKPPVNGTSQYTPATVVSAPTTPNAVIPTREIMTTVSVASNGVKRAAAIAATPVSGAPVQPVTVWEKAEPPAFTLAPSTPPPNPWQATTPADKSPWDPKPNSGTWK